MEPKRSDIPSLLSEFPEPDFYVAEHAVREAVARRTNFNIIDNTAGDKVDFWILKDTPFDHERFSRRKPGLVGTQPVEFASAEDTILRKLVWSREMGGSQRQLEDVLRIFRVQRGNLDQSYLRRWAADLGVTDLLEQVSHQAKLP